MVMEELVIRVYTKKTDSSVNLPYKIMACVVSDSHDGVGRVSSLHAYLLSSLEPGILDHISVFTRVVSPK